MSESYQFTVSDEIFGPDTISVEDTGRATQSITFAIHTLIYTLLYKLYLKGDKRPLQIFGGHFILPEFEAGLNDALQHHLELRGLAKRGCRDRIIDSIVAQMRTYYRLGIFEKVDDFGSVEGRDDGVYLVPSKDGIAMDVQEDSEQDVSVAVLDRPL